MFEKIKYKYRKYKAVKEIKKIKSYVASNGSLQVLPLNGAAGGVYPSLSYTGTIGVTTIDGSYEPGVYFILPCQVLSGENINRIVRCTYSRKYYDDELGDGYISFIRFCKTIWQLKGAEYINDFEYYSSKEKAVE